MTCQARRTNRRSTYVRDGRRLAFLENFILRQRALSGGGLKPRVFWGASSPQEVGKHLLRELEKVDLRNDSAEWRAFAKKLGRWLRDGMRLRKRPDLTPGKFQNRVNRLNGRLAKPAAEAHVDADTRRLTKRLAKYAEFILTFLDYADVPFDNNFAERQIRPAVIL